MSKQHILTIALIAIGFSLYLGLKPLFEFLPSDSIGRETIAAVIGAILITLVTQLLLTHQQNIEQQNKKHDEIFRARLSLYQNFIQQFFDNISDSQLTTTEHKKLKGLLFRIYAVGGQQAIAELDKLEQVIEGLITKDEDSSLSYEEIEMLESNLRRVTYFYLRDDLIGEKMKLSNKAHSALDTNIESNDEIIAQQQKSENHITRNTDKEEFKNKRLSKTEFVLEVFRDQIKKMGGSNLTYEKFEEIMEQKKSEARLNKYEEKHFEVWRAMPIWTTFETAENIRQKSIEGERWKRYRMEESIKLKDKSIVIRNGQSAESVSAVRKFFQI